MAKIPTIPPISDDYKKMIVAKESAWQRHIDKWDMDKVYKEGTLNLRRQEFHDGFGAGWQANHKEEMEVVEILDQLSKMTSDFLLRLQSYREHLIAMVGSTNKDTQGYAKALEELDRVFGKDN